MPAARAGGVVDEEFDRKSPPVHVFKESGPINDRRTCDRSDIKKEQLWNHFW